MQANEIETVDDAIAYLEENTGQTYILKDAAEKVIEPFSGQYGMSDTAGGIARGISERAGDARGMLFVEDDELVCTIEDITAALCRHLGLEASEANMVGFGSTADVRHDENMDALREFVDE